MLLSAVDKLNVEQGEFFLKPVAQFVGLFLCNTVAVKDNAGFLIVNIGYKLHSVDYAAAPIL